MTVFPVTTGIEGGGHPRVDGSRRGSYPYSDGEPTTMFPDLPTGYIAMCVAILTRSTRWQHRESGLWVWPIGQRSDDLRVFPPGGVEGPHRTSHAFQ